MERSVIKEIRDIDKLIGKYISDGHDPRKIMNLTQFQIIHYLDQLIGQIINEVGNNLAGEHELVSTVIRIDHLTQPLVKLDSLNFVCAAIRSNSLLEEFEQGVEFCNRKIDFIQFFQEVIAEQID